MNVEEAGAAFREELRTVAWPGETLEAGPLVTRRRSSGEDTVTAFALDEGNVDAAIRAQLAIGRPFEWKAFSFDRPADLVDRLRAAGFSVGEREAVVVYDLADGLDPFESDAEVRRVRDGAGLAEFRRTAEAAFGKDYGPTTESLAAALRSDRRGHDGYLALLDGVPTSVGRLYTNPESRFAGLYGGGTRPEFRGRGLYRAVVAVRARDAAAVGARYLQVDARPTSLPILQRMGFVRIADTWPCAWAPS